jgi:uncharacterized protein YceH (UPF0502 family)
VNDALIDIELRIMACLVEKEITTPDYYPLTLNSLTAACNQKSNRNPVGSYDEAGVERGLDELRRKGMVQMSHAPGSRTAKYRHSFLENYQLIPREAAILCELMLRGPQTVGELRTHAGRMYEFKDLHEVEETLHDLKERGQPLVVKLGRQPGKREERYMHLLSGMERAREYEQAAPAEAGPPQAQEGSERIAKLEGEVAELRKGLDDLKKSFDEFRSQFR